MWLSRLGRLPHRASRRPPRDGAACAQSQAPTRRLAGWPPIAYIYFTKNIFHICFFCKRNKFKVFTFFTCLLYPCLPFRCMLRVGGLSSSEEAAPEETVGMSAGDAAQAEPATAADPAAATNRGPEAPAEEAADAVTDQTGGGRRRRGRGPRKGQLKDSVHCEICWGRHANDELAKAQHCRGEKHLTWLYVQTRGMDYHQAACVARAEVERNQQAIRKQTLRQPSVPSQDLARSPRRERRPRSSRSRTPLRRPRLQLRERSMRASAAHGRRPHSPQRQSRGRSARRERGGSRRDADRRREDAEVQPSESLRRAPWRRPASSRRQLSRSPRRQARASTVRAKPKPDSSAQAARTQKPAAPVEKRGKEGTGRAPAEPRAAATENASSGSSGSYTYTYDDHSQTEECLADAPTSPAELPAEAPVPAADGPATKKKAKELPPQENPPSQHRAKKVEPKLKPASKAPAKQKPEKKTSPSPTEPRKAKAMRLQSHSSSAVRKDKLGGKPPASEKPGKQVPKEVKKPQQPVQRQAAAKASAAQPAETPPAASTEGPPLALSAEPPSAESVFQGLLRTALQEAARTFHS